MIIIISQLSKKKMIPEIYTDGSCIGNPGPGGWAAICENVFTVCGDSVKTTNNIMELTAAIRGLEKAHEMGMPNVVLYTDSNYVKKGITEWVLNWEKNNWVTASTGKPVKNKQVWINLLEVSKKFIHIEWKWVKAHNGNLMNEKVDKLARSCAEKKIMCLIHT